MDAAVELFPVSYKAITRFHANRMFFSSWRDSYLDGVNDALWIRETLPPSNQKVRFLTGKFKDWIEESKEKPTWNRHSALAFDHALEILSGLDKQFVGGGGGAGMYPLHLAWGREYDNL